MNISKKYLALPLMAISGAAMAQHDPSHPNVVFILGDDMGYSGIHCYGGNNIPSPNIDYLAANGIQCMNFHATPLSSPTRVALLTGNYQQRAGLNHIFSEIDPMDGLDPAVHPSLTKLLQTAGYRTGIMGKWHLGQDIKFNPLNNGFDVWHGYTMGNIDFHSHYNTQHKIDWWDGKELKDEPGYVTHLINKYSVEFIRESVEKEHKPFFLFVSHNAVHVPMQGPNDPVLRTPEVCPYRNDQDMTDAEYQRVYCDMVEAVDQGVGQIMTTLRELGVLENTLIIYTSDNGGEAIAAQKFSGNNGYFRGAKGSLYEGGIRVPAIFYYPKGWGHHVNVEPMMSFDLLPTILDFCNVKNDRKTDGISCLPMLEGCEPLPYRPEFFATTGSQAMLDGNWKMVWTKKENQDVIELFNLVNDVHEEHDVSALYPERAARMKKQIEEWWQDVTKGTKLEGKTTFNSGWMYDITPEQMQRMRRGMSARDVQQGT